MTSNSTSRRHALITLGAAAASTVLPACSNNDNGGSDGTAQVRAINLSSDIASADLFFNDTRQFTALVPETLGLYVNLSSADYTVKVKKLNDASTLLQGTYSIVKDKHYTAVIWGRETVPRLSTLPEDEDDSAIGPDTARLRVFSATSDSGTMDVYLTNIGATTNLADEQVAIGGVTAGQLTGFKDFTSTKSYRLRVTGVGDPNDVRLDIPSITLNTKKHNTLILTPGSGGVLVNGRLLEQQGVTTALPNTKARMRVVAGADTAGNVAVTIAGRTLAGGLRSPSVGPYQLVDAGSVATVVRINGAIVDQSTRTLTAGSDYTLLAYGTNSVALIADDNRLPTTSTRVKIRLLHGANGVDPLTLSVEYFALATDQPVGGASAYVTTAAASSVRVDVTAASAVAPIYSATEVNLQAQGVYTVFVLGGNTATTGVIRKER